MRYLRLFAVTIAVMLMASGCQGAYDKEAFDDDAIIIDVRNLEEFNSGHIPGALILPLPQLAEEIAHLVPDLDQPIILYCRSGNRSNQALDILTSMGYTNVHDMGGIYNWTGEIVTNP